MTMAAKTDRVDIISCAGVLPDNTIIITPDKDILTVFSTGILSDGPRHIWRAQHQQQISLLMKTSLLNALQQVGMQVNQLDYVIVSLVWPATLLDEEVSALVRETQLRCPVVPVSSGTAGGLTALELAAGLISQGNYRNIAVIAACSYAHWFRPDDPATSLLSDGAACMILASASGSEIISSHTISTHDYAPLVAGQINGARYVSYPPESGQFIAEHYPETAARCCRSLCEKAAISLADIDAFHIYDPTNWVASASATALGVDRRRIFSIFQQYGSLGPAQNYFGFMTLINHRSLSDGDRVILLGFGPAATATAVLLKVKKVPVSITHQMT